MKNILSILIAFIIANSTFTQDWIEFATSDITIPNYSMIKSNDTVVEFEIEVPGMFSTVIDTFNRLEIREHFKMDSAGLPEMPVVSYLMAIPSCDSVNITISLLDSVKYSNFNIYHC